MRRPYCVAGAAFVAASCLAGPLILFSATDAKPPTVSETQIKDLIQRIEKLEARVAELEKKRALVALPAGRIPKSLRIAKPLPKGWVRKQFKGLEYYIIPLDAAQTAATQPPK